MKTIAYVLHAVNIFCKFAADLAKEKLRHHTIKDYSNSEKMWLLNVDYSKDLEEKVINRYATDNPELKKYLRRAFKAGFAGLGIMIEFLEKAMFNKEAYDSDIYMQWMEEFSVRDSTLGLTNLERACGGQIKDKLNSLIG